MKIDKKLNLVIPILNEKDEPVAYVHSTPISSDVFDKYFLPIAKTYSSIYSEGLGHIGGPRIADKMLKRISEELKCWDGRDGVALGLIAEIHRLTNVVCIKQTGGWEMLQYADAKKMGVVSPEDASEIEAALVFFTVASAMHRKAQVADLVGGAMKLWGAQIESLGCMEWMNSLSTSTATAIGAKTAA